MSYAWIVPHPLMLRMGVQAVRFLVSQSDAIADRRSASMRM
jgi:hypothetical protein